MENLNIAVGGNISLTAAGTALSTNTLGVKTVNTLTYLNDGMFKSKAGTDNLTLTAAPASFLTYQTPLQYGNVPVGYTVFVLCMFDLSGNFVSYMGIPRLTADITNNLGAAQMPFPQQLYGANVNPMNSGYTPFALVKIVNATNVFIPGTTALNATGVTATFQDIAALPASPLPF